MIYDNWVIMTRLLILTLSKRKNRWLLLNILPNRLKFIFLNLYFKILMNRVNPELRESLYESLLRTIVLVPNYGKHKIGNDRVR